MNIALLSGHGWLLLTLFMLVLLACAIPLGLYIAKLADNAPLPYFNRAEQWLYRCCGCQRECLQLHCFSYRSI